MRRIVWAAMLAIGAGAVSAASVTIARSLSVERILDGLVVFGGGAVILGAAGWLGKIRLAEWAQLGPETDLDIFLKGTRFAHAKRRDLDSSQSILRDFPTNESFDALVHRSLDDLPLETHRVLEHVLIEISDSRRRAYGRYMRDSRRGGPFHHRIVIYRYRLLRDFGQHPDVLQAQVMEVVQDAVDIHCGRK